MTAPLTFDAPLVLGAQIDVRAAHPELADKPLLLDGRRTWSWRRFRDEAVRTAEFLRSRLEPVDDARPGSVGMILENHFELLSLYAGCGYAGYTLFGINTGVRGETLAGVINASGVRLLVVDQRFHAEVERVASQLENVAAENILVLRTGDGPVVGNDFDAALSEVAAEGVSLDTPAVDVDPQTNLMVIYTSGTTGLPKGINNNHFKLLAIGMAIAGRLELERSTVGYACMPLFHSNAMFLGFQPAFQVGGTLAMRDRFSASQFVPDILRHGVTYWNYVGEPVHYILGALEKAHGGDEARILAEVAGHPDNHLRYALGNGAAPPDIDRFIRWLGLEDMFELYGSTEAAISTFRRKTDPRGSVGVVDDDAVRILREDGAECPAADVDADGKITNYAEAVGEICRVAAETGLFQGYFDNEKANESKFRAGVYHSGDLGHLRIIDDKRYLYFDGRTDDWIRKDGENFSAAQVARLLMEHPDITLAAAYGAPCAVSDELVMAALKLRPGAQFVPEAFYAWCEEQVAHGGMDRKWFPDFLRLVEEFEFTQTQKILVRHLKKDHFHRERLAGEPLFWRTRTSGSYDPFTPEDFQALRAEFDRAERGALIDR